MSKTPEWYTPDNILSLVYSFYENGVDLDPCTNSKIKPNVIAKAYFDVTDNGIDKSWAGRIYVNPPYGRVIKDWVSKCYKEYNSGDAKEILLLVPARVDTKWFKIVSDYPWCSIEGRLKFKDDNGTSGAPAPFPSALIYLGKRKEQFKDIFSKLGKVYNL